MSTLFQPVVTLLIGVAMSIYGLIHSITRFPGPEAFLNLMANMPAVMSVLFFVLGVLAFVAGVVLIVLGVRNMRRRWRQFGRIARHVESQPQYQQDEDGWPAYR